MGVDRTGLDRTVVLRREGGRERGGSGRFRVDQQQPESGCFGFCFFGLGCFLSRSGPEDRKSWRRLPWAAFWAGLAGMRDCERAKTARPAERREEGSWRLN